MGIKLTMQFTLAGMAMMAFFIVTQNSVFGMSEQEDKDIRRKQNQVAFRDPKLIAEHKQKLDAINAKRQAVRESEK